MKCILLGQKTDFYIFIALSQVKKLSFKPESHPAESQKEQENKKKTRQNEKTKTKIPTKNEMKKLKTKIRKRKTKIQRRRKENQIKTRKNKTKKKRIKRKITVVIEGKASLVWGHRGELLSAENVGRHFLFRIPSNFIRFRVNLSASV